MLIIINLEQIVLLLKRVNKMIDKMKWMIREKYIFYRQSKPVLYIMLTH